jgi:hypothetical protein
MDYPVVFLPFFLPLIIKVELLYVPPIVELDQESIAGNGFKQIIPISSESEITHPLFPGVPILGPDHKKGASRSILPPQNHIGVKRLPVEIR